MQISPLILTGKATDHLVPLPPSPYLVHREMLSAVQSLQKRAKRDGIELRVASSFRDYALQEKIWNEKATGRRDLLDAGGKKLEFSRLSPEEILEAIMRWSALPGASRHHWGTDLDVYDLNTLPKGERLRFSPQEAEPGGIQAHCAKWLGENLKSEGFFRPYATDLGGVSPEWWHISYQPVASRYYDAFTFDVLQDVVQNSKIALKDIVISRLPEIFQKYVRNITLP
jgi:LAS superfamily LD-carboxypeptidase LdcB